VKSVKLKFQYHKIILKVKKYSIVNFLEKDDARVFGTKRFCNGTETDDEKKMKKEKMMKMFLYKG